MFYFFILSILLLASCKKKEEPNNGPDWSPEHANYTCRVIDTITGLPIANIWVSSFASEDPYLVGSIITDNNGYYNEDFVWGAKFSLWKYMPHPNTDLLVEVNSQQKYGFVKFKAGALVVNGTITLPNLYVKNVGYLKAHIKDTTGVNADALGIRTSYPFFYPYEHPGTEFWPIYPTNFYNSSGHLVDTTFVESIKPNQNTIFRWKYSKNGITHNDSLLFSTPSNDTTFVNVFY